jgi:hypothetical protein
VSTQRYTERPELDTDGRQICWRCCEPYLPDTSVNLVLCQVCDLEEFEMWEQGSL